MRMSKAKQYFFAALGGASSIFFISQLDRWFELAQTEITFLIGSFGASAVLVYGVPEAEFSQPRNLIGGHLISALIGVSTAFLLGYEQPLAAPFSVAFAILAMQFTNTVHPPGGATALIAVIGSEKIKNLGFFYILCPVLTGVFIMFTIAFIINNLRGRNHPKYPTRWF